MLEESLAQIGPVMLKSGFGTEEQLRGLIAWARTNQTPDIALLTISSWGRKPAG
jgi:hypothetical protein